MHTCEMPHQLHAVVMMECHDPSFSSSGDDRGDASLSRSLSLCLSLLLIELDEQVALPPSTGWIPIIMAVSHTPKPSKMDLIFKSLHHLPAPLKVFVTTQRVRGSINSAEFPC